MRAVPVRICGTPGCSPSCSPEGPSGGPPCGRGIRHRPELRGFPSGKRGQEDRALACMLHAEGNPQAGLLPAGGFRAGVVPGKDDIPRLGRGFGLPQSTAYRYLDEVIEVVAARAPGLQDASERALAEGVPYLSEAGHQEEQVSSDPALAGDGYRVGHRNRRGQPGARHTKRLACRRPVTARLRGESGTTPAATPRRYTGCHSRSCILRS
jgi:hypothetical protein